MKIFFERLKRNVSEVKKSDLLCLNGGKVSGSFYDALSLICQNNYFFN